MQRKAGDRKRMQVGDEEGKKKKRERETSRKHFSPHNMHPCRWVLPLIPTSDFPISNIIRTTQW